MIKPLFYTMWMCSFLVPIFGCKNSEDRSLHHPNEGFVKRVLMYPDSIDYILQNTEINTSFYLDSILHGHRPSRYWGDHLEEFREHELELRGEKYYQEYTLDDKNYPVPIHVCLIGAQSKKTGSKILFSFERKDGDVVWNLNFIDISVNGPKL